MLFALHSVQSYRVPQFFIPSIGSGTLKVKIVKTLQNKRNFRFYLVTRSMNTIITNSPILHTEYDMQ